MLVSTARRLAAPLLKHGSAAAPAAGAVQKRFLNVHEYISMDLMKAQGITVPKGHVAFSAEEAEKVAHELLDGKQNADVVVKAQVLAGGRGLGTFTNGFHGGVHVATSVEQAKGFADKMIGQKIVTKQTGEEGRRVDKVFIVERLYLRREMYFSILMDRAYNGPVFIASSRGGTSIEDIAASTPDLIIKEAVSIMTGPTDAQLDRLAAGLGLKGSTAEEAKQTINKLWQLFREKDATLLEVNPISETKDGHVMVCDAKINFDDNAIFRQKEVFAQRDFTQEDSREVEASRHDLNYIGLDGNIGCMVNGAGLAMATMDIIKLHGGMPANFLDVGGGASAEQVTEAFKILNNDPKVMTILVNIFGGIMRCDTIAHGIVAAAKTIGLKKPVVLRLQGTNVMEAKAFIASTPYKIITVDDLDKAAEVAVAVAEIKRQAEQVELHVSFELPL